MFKRMKETEYMQERDARLSLIEAQPKWFSDVANWSLFETCYCFSSICVNFTDIDREVRRLLEAFFDPRLY